MGADLTELLNQVKNAPLVLLFGVLLVLLSSLLTIANSFALITRIYKNTIGGKREKLFKIRRLATSVNIAFFDDLLGRPAFITKMPSGSEYIYVDSLFYVQAITNEDDSIIAFFVTTRDARFHPELVIGPFTLNGKPVRIKLGKTHFKEMSSLGEPDSCFSSHGARTYSYHERWYFGNPGYYQTFV